MSDCLFCAIAAHDLPAELVREDDDVVAFRDVNPQAPVHVLVIPREHLGSLLDLDAEHDALWARLLHAAQHIARSEGIAETGFRVVANVGRDGGQTVGHLHLHVLGNRPMSWPPG